MSGNTYGYFAKTVAENLGISPNTLRRWSLELEKQGYEFDRSDSNKRIYYEKDMKAFRELKSLLDAAVSMENATKTVVSTTETRESESVTAIVREQRETQIQPFSEEKFKIMMKEAMMEAAATATKPVLEELQKVQEELREQKKENEELKQMMQRIETHTEQIEKMEEKEQTKQTLGEINSRMKSFDERLKDTINSRKQEPSKSFFKRLFNK